MIYLALLALLLLPAQAQAALARVTGCAAQSNTCTLGATPSSNNIILYFAHRDGSTTAPSLPAGFTSITTASGSTNSARVAYKLSNGTEGALPTATNATSVCSIVLSGNDTTTPIGKFTTNTGSSATLTYGALKLLSADGTSWLFAGGAHRTATNVTGSPTGLTAQQTATDIECLDTSGGVGVRSSSTLGVNASSGWATAVVEVLPADSATSGTPLLAQYRFGTLDMGNVTSGTYEIFLPNPTLSGNCIVLGFQSSGGTFTITDDQSNNWPAVAVSVTSGQVFQMWVKENATAGTRNIHVTLDSGTTTYIQYAIAEYYHCKQHLPLDVTWTMSSDAGTALSFGAATTSQNNEVIVTYAAQVAVDNFATSMNHDSYTAGTGATLIAVNPNNGSFLQEQVQATAGSVTPSATVRGTEAWTGAGVAIKGDDTAGTAPSSTNIRIVGIASVELTPGSTVPASDPFKIQFPTRGNLSVITYIGQPATGGNATISSITTDGVSWTQAGSDATNSGIGTGQIFYRENVTPSATSTGSIDLVRSTSGGGFASLIYFYDVANAATSAFDTASNTSGTQSSNANLTTSTITPTTQPGITFNVVPIDSHCLVTLTTPATYLYDGGHNAGSDGGDTRWAECDGFAHTARHTSTSALTYTYQTINNTAGVQNWTSVAAAFKEAVAAAADNSFFRRRINP